jgi:hypothetical protein
VLFELVLRLKCFELKHNITLHVVHISRNWKIAEGMDGLSWTRHREGVMLGKDIWTFIPLHLHPVVLSGTGTKMWLGHLVLNC